MAKVYSIDVDELPRIEPSSSIMENESWEKRTNRHDGETISIDNEKLIQAENENLRRQKFRTIFLDSPIEFSFLRISIYICGTIMASFLLTLGYSLIPLHNTIEQPEYWYDVLLTRPVFCTFMAITYHISAGTTLNIRHIQNIRNCLTTGVIYNIFWCILYVSTYIVWTQLIHLSWPLPFYNLLFYFICNPVIFISIYLQYFPSWRKCNDFNTRYLYFCLWWLYSTIVTNFQYNFLAKLLLEASYGYQPVIALLLPMIKKMNGWFYGLFAKKISHGDSNQTKIALKYFLSSRHAVFLCVAFEQRVRMDPVNCQVLNEYIRWSEIDQDEKKQPTCT